jgi:hypothetical protein
LFSSWQFAEKPFSVEECGHGGLKPALILNALRGAEAPLFDVAADRWEFFSRLVV